MTHVSAIAKAVGHLRLDFGDGASKVPGSLSAVEQIKDTLWLAGDETASVERLITTDYANFGSHTSFALKDFFNLPGGDEQEADLEGLAVDQERNRLWLVGSHSLRRSQPKPGQSSKQAAAALSSVSRQANRYLLGYIKLNSEGKVDPIHGSGRCLQFDYSESSFVKMLGSDSGLSPFLSIPSKDNGLDIEGLAVSNGMIFIGLRGPVLRGWASVLQLSLEHVGQGILVPRPSKPLGRCYLQHLLDLGGLGIRDLCVDGDDLLILAGPTMALDGPITLFRWRHAFGATRDMFVDNATLQRLFDIPWGSHVDHAEGIALFRPEGHDPHLLVVYDSPCKNRLHHGKYFEADLFVI